MLKRARKWLFLTVLLGGIFVFLAPQAEAGTWWGCGWGWGAWCGPVCAPLCSPCCTIGACDPCCDGWYLGPRPGPVRRLLFGPYRWYRTAGWCSVCCYDPCCCWDEGTVVSVESKPVQAEVQKPTLAPPPIDRKPSAEKPAMPVWPTPAPPQQAPPAAPTPPTPSPSNPVPQAPMTPPAGTPNEPAVPKPATGAALHSGDGTISILVPEDAVVTINGYTTKSTGRVRKYVSQDLKPGLVYPFSIRVDVVRDGRAVSETQQVKLTRGALEAVVFDFAPKAVEGLAQAK